MRLGRFALHGQDGVGPPAQIIAPGAIGVAGVAAATADALGREPVLCEFSERREAIGDPVIIPIITEIDLSPRYRRPADRPTTPRLVRSAKPLRNHHHTERLSRRQSGVEPGPAAVCVSPQLRETERRMRTRRSRRDECDEVACMLFGRCARHSLGGRPQA